MSEKYGFVYLWRDKKHNRYYIGSHWGTENDGYICSSRWMRKAYNRRQEDFKRRILSRVYTNRNDLLNEEQRWFDYIKPKEFKTKYYNINSRVLPHWSTQEETYRSVKQKLSDTAKANHADPEYREKYLAGLETRDNKASDPQTSEKKRQAMIKTMADKFPDRHQPLANDSQEYRDVLSQKSKEMWADRSDEDRAAISKKISETNKGLKTRLGHTNSPEHRAKISAAQKGKKLSPEQREKMAAARRGTKQTDEQKAARSLRMKEMWAARKAAQEDK